MFPSLKKNSILTWPLPPTTILNSQLPFATKFIKRIACTQYIYFFLLLLDKQASSSPQFQSSFSSSPLFQRLTLTFAIPMVSAWCSQQLLTHWPYEWMGSNGLSAGSVSPISPSYWEAKSFCVLRETVCRGLWGPPGLGSYTSSTIS